MEISVLRYANRLRSLLRRAAFRDRELRFAELANDLFRRVLLASWHRVPSCGSVPLPALLTRRWNRLKGAGHLYVETPNSLVLTSHQLVQRMGQLSDAIRHRWQSRERHASTSAKAGAGLQATMLASLSRPCRNDENRVSAPFHVQPRSADRNGRQRQSQR